MTISTETTKCHIRLIALYRHHHWDGGEETVTLPIYKPSYAHLWEEDRQPLDVAAGNQEKSAKQPPPDLGCQRRMERGRGELLFTPLQIGSTSDKSFQ